MLLHVINNSMDKNEFEPQPKTIEELLSDQVTLILGKHRDYIHHSQPQSTLHGEELLLRASSGRFYRVLRATRLSDEGTKAMDSLDRTHAVGDRFLHRNTSDSISRHVTGGLEDYTEEIVLTVKDGPNMTTVDQLPLTVLELEDWFSEISEAEPMEYQVPIGE